jgi:hypothetical protein
VGVLCAVLANPASAQGDGSKLSALLSGAYGPAIASSFPISDRKAVAECVGKAFTSGIPEDDQALIVSAFETKQLTSQSKTAIEKWIGGAAIHGALRKPSFNDPSTYPNGGLSYADGTPQLQSDEDVERRVGANLKKFCPIYAERVFGGSNSAPASEPPAPKPTEVDTSQFQHDTSECQQAASTLGGNTEQKRDSYRNCMKNRGYSVLN